jgi:predicted NAD/FAD-dependent oxidoreductase
MSDVAIIGAGISGLACARKLVAAGHSVTLFDKGRGPGGRMSSKREATPLGEVAFDHGAQFFTARDASFAAFVATLESQGIVAPWSNVVRALPGGETAPFTETLWVGVPKMSSVVRALSDACDVRWGIQITRVEKGAKGLQLFADTHAFGPFERLVVAVPAEQASVLLSTLAPELAKAASSVTSAPCWAAMFAFDRALELPFNGCEFSAHSTLGFVAQNHTKPGRADITSLVVHANAAWSSAHLESSAEAVSEALLAALASITAVPAPVFSAAHRWRYARIAKGLGEGALWDDALQLGLCGDWLIAPRIESAFVSGEQLAARIG